VVHSQAVLKEAFCKLEKAERDALKKISDGKTEYMTII
jgi:hypothetical protein